MTTRELFIMALAVIFAGYAGFMTLALIKISDQNKAQQRALVCFDEAGRVTYGLGKECRMVAIRELKR